MGSEPWTEMKLSEIIDVKHGFAFSGDHIREEPTPNILLTPGNFAVGGGFKTEKFKYFDGEVPEEYVLHENDLIVTMTDLSKQSDTLGYPALVPRSKDFRFLHNQRLGKVVIQDDTKANKLFLSYLLRTREYRQEVLASATGTTVKHTSPNRILAFKTLIPPLIEQRAIAYVLATLDNKIELNRRMNETLEAMVHALFKSWFSDLEPVRNTVAEFIRERVLEIGDGYRAKNSELGSPGLPFIRAGDLNNGFGTAHAELLRNDSVAKAGAKISRVGDVAFTSKGTVGRFARVTEHTERFVYSPQICYWRSLDASRLHPVILYCWMQSDDLATQIAAVAGQTDMAPYVSLQDQRQMTMPIFPPSQHIIADQIVPLLSRQSLNDAQSKTLAALRDSLLPKLISGELRVRNVDHSAESVTAGPSA